MSIAVSFAQNQNTIVYWVDAANRAATPQNSSRTMIPAHCRKPGASGGRGGRCPALVAAATPMRSNGFVPWMGFNFKTEEPVTLVAGFIFQLS